MLLNYFFPLVLLNSSLLTLLLLFNLSSRSVVLIIGWYLLHQEDLFRRGRASVVKRSFNPQLVDAHWNEQPTRITPLSLPSTSHQQAGLAEWLLGGLSVHLAEELVWEAGHLCIRHNQR